jgi:hypothetical protein
MIRDRIFELEGKLKHNDEQISVTVFKHEDEDNLVMFEALMSFPNRPAAASRMPLYPEDLDKLVESARNGILWRGILFDKDNVAVPEDAVKDGLAAAVLDLL